MSDADDIMRQIRESGADPRAIPFLVSQETLAHLMDVHPLAVANAALPDGERITRDEVRALADASVIFRVGDMEVAQNDEATALVQSLAAKLAKALLPE